MAWKNRLLSLTFHFFVLSTLLLNVSLFAAAPGKERRAVPSQGVETKVKQVPTNGSEGVPLWKIHWEKARQSVLAQKYPEALQQFRQALSFKPNLDEARLELAQVLVSMEKWGEAAKELEMVVENQPQNLKIKRELADLLTKQKEYRRANELYQWLLQRDPDNLPLRLALANNLQQINESERAMIEWRQVLIRDPQHVEARINLAEALAATRRLDEAVMILEGLVKQFPKQTALKKKLAQTLVAAQRNKEALPYLQELIRQDPNETDVQLLLAKVLSAGKQYDQSLAYLEAYLKKKPDQSAALLEKARALFYTREYPRSLEIYERLIKNDPDNVSLQREMADVYFAAGKIAQALAAYEALTKKFHDDYQLQERTGELYLQLKDYPQAVAAFETALKLEPENHFAQWNLARAYQGKGEKQKALELYRNILKTRDDRQIRIEMADLLFDLHQYEEAFAVFREILKDQPHFWEVRFKLAQGLYHQRDYEGAEAELEILVRERPDDPSIRILRGYNALSQGDYLGAQEAFQKVLAMGEDMANTLLRLGELARIMGRPWQGVGYLDWALSLKPEDVAILREKAMALTDGGAFAQARRILEPLLARYPQDFHIRRAWIRLLAALDRRDESQAGWKRLENAFPQEQYLIFQDRAEYYLRWGKPEAALTALKAAQIRNPRHREIQKVLGRLLLRMKRWKEAAEHYREMEARHVFRDEVLRAKALLAGNEGQVESAREWLWQALLVRPDSLEVRFALFQVLCRLEKDGESLKKIEETLKDFARSRRGGLTALAGLYEEAGEKGKAYVLIREIIETSDDEDELVEAAVRLPRVFPTKGNLSVLQQSLEDLQKRFPRNQRIARLLADHYSQVKEFAEALKVIEGLLQVEDPRDPLLTLKKARILTRWNKHWDAQAAYQRLLEPPVEEEFKKGLEKIVSEKGNSEAAELRALVGKQKSRRINGLYEEIAKRLPYLTLDPMVREKISALLQDLEEKVAVQRKVFLEKEGKDHLWRSQFLQARPLLEELKDIDPDNEEVEEDLYRSYRNQNP